MFKCVCSNPVEVDVEALITAYNYSIKVLQQELAAYPRQKTNTSGSGYSTEIFVETITPLIGTIRELGHAVSTAAYQQQRISATLGNLSNQPEAEPDVG